MNRSVVLIISIVLSLSVLFAAGQPVYAEADDGQQLYLPYVTLSKALPAPGEPGSCLNSEEVKLAALVNEYRRANGLADAPLSRSLSMVAQYHVRDLQNNNPDSGTDSRGMTCNMHSWSDKGHWTPVCYTSDHKYAEGMWFKPREITGGVYQGYGFENAAWARPSPITAQWALDLWKNSPGHNNVIVEKGGWEGSNWPAMGVGIYENYAVLWFGSDPDPAGSIEACPNN